MTSAAAAPPATYRERLLPAAWVWASAVGFAVALGLVFARISSGAAFAGAAVGGLAAVGFLARTTPLVAVGGGELTAGRARIPLALLGHPEVLAATAMRHERGPGLDARAYLLIRGWIATGVKLPLSDPLDPTPYWLLSTRHPEALAAALEAARSTAV